MDRPLIKTFLFLMSTVQALDNGLFLTPPMGWLSWARFRGNIDCENFPNDCINEKLYQEMADRMAEDGWKDAGYVYLSVDDCWESLAGRDPTTKQLLADPKRFPSGMKALGDYIHSKGLKYGMYSDVGPKTCAGYPASFGHYQLDAKTFASWGVDSLKFDGCNVESSTYSTLYPEMGKALLESGRPIAYICSWPAYIIDTADYNEIRQYCNSWRNYHDIDDAWESVNSIITWFADQQNRTASAAAPGAWNDPDMLVIGNYGLSHGQAKIQMALWCIMAAPLMMSNDLRSIPQSAVEILQNKELIAVNQDPLGRQGKRILTLDRGNVEIWTRKLDQDQLAVAFVRRFNGDPYFPSEYSVSLSAIGWNDKVAHIHDLFSGSIEVTEKELKLTVEPFGVTMVRLSKTTPRVLKTTSNGYTLSGLFSSTRMFSFMAFSCLMCLVFMKVKRHWNTLQGYTPI